MKKIVFLCLILHYFSNSQCQNLVPNSNFEIHDSCSVLCCGIQHAPPWFANDYPIGGAGYFHDCLNTMIIYYGVPHNLGNNLSDTQGFQWPRSGLAYAGINTYTDLAPNHRNYIEVKLTDTLKANYEYCVSFYINLCNGSEYGSDRMGACFTADTLGCALPNFACLINRTPQIQSPVGEVLSDSLNWTLVSGTFTAQGNERFMTIGNFYPDSLTTIAFNDSTKTYSTFYYIDDVSVKLCDSTFSIKENSTLNRFTVSPNPANGLITITIKKQIEEIELLNGFGNLILKQRYAKTIDVSNVADGLYLLKCMFKDGEIGYKKIVVLKH